MAVGILDAELAEAVRRVVDRVVDRGASLLHLRVHGVRVVDPDVGIPDLVHDLPVRHDPVRVGTEREEDRGLVSGRGGEVGWIAVDLAIEAE